MSDNEILGKTFSELVPVTEAKKSALIAIDNGESECNTISVENLLKDIEPSKGSGFDFEGTKAEFNNAVTSGEITDDSVSLITDDYSSVDEQIGALAEQLNNKMDLPTGKSQSDVDFVVEIYHDDDGNWYRVYKSGWVEQGGYNDTTSVIVDQYFSQTFIKPFVSKPSYIQVQICKKATEPLFSNVYNLTGVVDTVTSLSMNYGFRSGDNRITKVSSFWYACGQGAN